MHLTEDDNDTNETGLNVFWAIVKHYIYIELYTFTFSNERL